MRSIVTLAEDHVEEDGECRWCSSTWPCAVGVALAEVDRLRARLAELEGAIRAVRGDLAGLSGSPGDGTGPEPPLFDLWVALGSVIPPEKQV